MSWPPNNRICFIVNLRWTILINVPLRPTTYWVRIPRLLKKQVGKWNSAAMMATKNSAGVALGDKSKEPSSEVKNRDISGPTKRTDYMKFLKTNFINCLHRRTVRWSPGCRRTRVAGDSSSGSSCTCYHPQCSWCYTGWGRTGLSHSHSLCLVKKWMNEKMNEWMKKQMNEGINEQKDKWMNKWMNE